MRTKSKRTLKRRRMQLAKSELLLEAACWADSHAASAAHEPDCGTIPFEEWPADDPQRVIARRYGLTGQDLAKIWRALAQQLENAAMRAGYEDAWVGMDSWDEAEGD